MASLTFSSLISKSGRLVPRIASGRRALQSTPDSALGAEAVDTVKHGADEAMKAGENISTRAAHTARDVTEKAKQTAETAWGTAKETAQKAKDTVLGAAQDTKETIRENAAKVERSMNTKN